MATMTDTEKSRADTEAKDQELAGRSTTSAVYQADIRSSLASSEEAATTLARTLSSTIRVLVPPVVLRPAESFELVLDIMQRVLNIQRSLFQEFLGQTLASGEVAMHELETDTRGRQSADGRPATRAA